MTRTTPRVINGLGDAAAPVAGSALTLDPRTYERSLDCVHCGLCLPACPTYTDNGLEADSPRGRIYLIKGLADGRIEPTASVLDHLDLCLDCRACETACPSGVVYHELIEESRAKLADRRRPGMVDRFVDLIFYHVFPHPTRLKLAVLPARVMQKLGLWKVLVRSGLANVLPDALAKMQQMLPPTGPLWESGLSSRYPAAAPDGQRRATVAVMAGCVGSVMFQHVNRQMIRLLQHAGCDVVVPVRQVCCGAILHHGGRVDDAAALARTNVDVFLAPDASGDSASGPADTTSEAGAPTVATPATRHRTALSPREPDRLDPDFIVTNIAGCGAMLRDYGHLLRDDPAGAQRATKFQSKVRDISEVLAELLPAQAPRSIQRTVTYHDACHLAHAQKVTDPPRRLLGSIPDLKVIPLPESDMCCGAAGTYNLAHPAMARRLAERKIQHIVKTGATTCVTGNVGCAMQIQSEADRLGERLSVVHPVTLLHEAYFGADE